MWSFALRRHAAARVSRYLSMRLNLLVANVRRYRVVVARARVCIRGRVGRVRDVSVGVRSVRRRRGAVVLGADAGDDACRRVRRGPALLLVGRLRRRRRQLHAGLYIHRRPTSASPVSYDARQSLSAVSTIYFRH